MRAFVVLGLLISVSSQEIGLGKRLENDLLCVEWYVKPKLDQSGEVVCVTAVITCCRWHGGGDVGGEAGGRRYWRSGLGVLKNREQSVMSRRCIITRDVTEPAKICFRRIRILCFWSIGFGCGYGFATWSQLVLLNSYLSMSVYTKHRTGRHIAVPFSI